MADDGDMKSKGSFWQSKPSLNVRGNESLIAGFDQDVDSSDFAKKSETIRRLAGIQDSGPFSRQNARKLVWLDAWSDPVAGVSAYTPCVHTCDLFGDGDHRLIIADQDKKLKVWKGTAKAADHALLDSPVAITSFVSELAHPRLPSLAVAAGSHIYIYRNLRPYYKFQVPPEDVNTEEQDLWARVMEGRVMIGEAVDALIKLQEQGVVLTSRSLQLMNIGDADKKVEFVEHWQGQPLLSTTVLTCLEVINLSVDEPDAVSCLVAGTESGRVFILNPQGTAIVKNVFIGSAPVFMTIHGELEAGYRISVAARDGKIYSIRNGEVSQVIIQLESPAVGLVRLNKDMLVGCMNNSVHCFKADGHKNFTIYLPDRIVSMQKLEVQSARMSRCLLVALANGELRVYNEKNLVSIHNTSAPISGIWFGKYGREDNTLITVTKSGAVEIKILPRTAVLDGASIQSATPIEQDMPLQVPKKTRLYVEQTQREREQAVDMHRIFQRDLAKLRLTTARAYVKILTDGQGAAAFSSSVVHNLSLQLSVQGLGPRFKLVITVRNDGSAHVRDVPVLLLFDERQYSTSRRQMVLPLLVPTVSVALDVDVYCLDPDGGSGTISVLLANRKSSLPILQAQVKMPLSELEEAE